MRKRVYTLTLLIITMTTISHAYSFMVDGIAYNINSNGTSVTVTYERNPNDYSNSYSNLSGALNIPSTVTYSGKTYSVSSIGYRAFYNCPLTSVTIPNSVTEIGEYAFQDCRLTSVTIPNSVTTIGHYAFGECHNITSVTIPNSVTEIGGYAFGNCYNMTSVTIGNSVTKIGSYAFGGCTGLTSVNISDLVAWCNIYFADGGSNPLSNAHNLYLNGSKITDLVIPNSVSAIKQYAFFGCSSLTSVTIPYSVTTISQSAFGYCNWIGGNGLTSIIVEGGNTKYDSRNNCNAIIETETNILIVGCKNTIIPKSVTSIGERAFSECSGLTSVTIPNSVTKIGEYAFFYCEDLTSLTIGNSVTEIGEYAFFLTGLTSITIPNSVTEIGENAFICLDLTSITLTGQGAWNPKNNLNISQFSQLKTVNIGSGITSLGHFGFNPDIVNCYAAVPPACQSSTFANYDGELHVPSVSIAAYFTANYWKNFSNLNNDLTEKVTLNQTEANIQHSNTLALSATTNPGGGNVLWSTNNPAIATVSDEGVVTGIGEGECDIFATLESNPAVYASCHVNASYPEITVSLNSNMVEMQLGADTTLVATITPDSTGLTPTWTSTNTSVATVENGVVTAVGEGECDIIATVLDKTATCHVIVSGNVTIKLNMNNAFIGVNDMLIVYPSCTPDVPVDLIVTSSDSSVAIVRLVNRTNATAQSNAPALAGTKAIQIIGISNGVATITVASADGKAIPATLVVTVGASFVHGDVNGDGNVTAADITELYNYLLNGETNNLNSLDVNGDGLVTSADVTAVYDVLLGNWEENPTTLEQQLIGDWVSYQGFYNEYETHYIFNSDYTGSYKFIMNGTVYEDRSFTWSLDGNILSVTSAGNTSTFEISVEDDVLHMTANGNTINFNKVN